MSDSTRCPWCDGTVTLRVGAPGRMAVVHAQPACPQWIAKTTPAPPPAKTLVRGRGWRGWTA